MIVVVMTGEDHIRLRLLPLIADGIVKRIKQYFHSAFEIDHKAGMRNPFYSHNSLILSMQVSLGRWPLQQTMPPFCRLSAV